MQIKVDMQTQGVLQFLQAMQHQHLPVATFRALNKTATSAKSVAVKLVAAQMGIAQKEVRPSIALQKAQLRMLDAVLSATRNKRLPLIKIDGKATQGPSGVTYRGPGNIRRNIPHAFLALMPSGHRGIFKRLGKARLPILELSGPSIYYVFKQPLVQNALEKVVKERWPVCFEQELHFLRRKLT
jgi:hypothetical protein